MKRSLEEHVAARPSSPPRHELEDAILRLLVSLGPAIAPLLAQGLAKFLDLRVPPGPTTLVPSPLNARRTRALVRSGKLKAFKDGRTWYVRPADLEALVEADARPSVPATAPANDAHEGEDLDEAGERFAEQLLAAKGKKLGAEPRRSAGARGRR